MCPCSVISDTTDSVTAACAICVSPRGKGCFTLVKIYLQCHWGVLSICQTQEWCFPDERSRRFSPRRETPVRRHAGRDGEYFWCVFQPKMAILAAKTGKFLVGSQSSRALRRLRRTLNEPISYLCRSLNLASGPRGQHGDGHRIGAAPVHALIIQKCASVAWPGQRSLR